MDQPLSEAGSRPLLQWSFDPRMTHQRDQLWFLLAAVAGAAMIIYALWTGNFLFAILVVLFALTYIVVHRNSDAILFRLTARGVELNEQLYAFEDIKHFYIIYKPPQIKKLYFELRSGIGQRLIIPLDDADPAMVREVLVQYLTEDREREHEPVSDQFSRIFKI